MADKTISKEDRLRQVPLFSGLDKKHVVAIAQLADMIDIPEGRVVIREGGLADQFVMILEGKAKVEKEGEVVNHLSEGDFFGEIALIGRRPHAATISAETPMRVLVVHRSSFDDLLDQTPELWREIAIALCSYIS